MTFGRRHRPPFVFIFWPPAKILVARLIDQMASVYSASYISWNLWTFVWQYSGYCADILCILCNLCFCTPVPGTPVLMKIRPDLGHAHATRHSSLIIHHLHSFADNTSDKAAQILLPPSHPQSVLLNEQTQRLLRDSRDKPSTCQIISDLWA